jgi:tetratricopeptide (TPR) repeat protein
MSKKKPTETTKDTQATEYESASQSAVREKRVKRKIVIIALLIFLLLMAGAVYLYNEHNQTTSTDTSDSGDGTARPTYEVELTQLTSDELDVQAQRLRFSGQYEEAIELFEYQEGYSDSYDLQLVVASFYIAKGSIEDAIQHMLTMEERFGITKTLAENIADQAVLASDHDLAKNYYEKAIAEIENNPDDYPIAHLDIEDIEKKLEQLDD